MTCNLSLVSNQFPNEILKLWFDYLLKYILSDFICKTFNEGFFEVFFL